MVNTKGYSLTEFPVKTSDGYTLRTYRIQYGRDGAPKDTTKIRPPVLLLHGISLSSTSFVVNQPTESLAFILADAGECNSYSSAGQQGPQNNDDSHAKPNAI